MFWHVLHWVAGLTIFGLALGVSIWVMMATEPGEDDPTFHGDHD